MEIETKQENSVLVVKPLTHSIEASNSRQFKTKVIDLINQGNRNLVINLSEVNFIDSSGLGNMISILKLLATQQGNVVLCGIKEENTKLFHLTRLDQVFSIYPNEAEAFKFFSTKLTK